MLASGFYVFFSYVASDANPADLPSRCHRPRWRNEQRQDALSGSGEAAWRIWRLRLPLYFATNSRCGVSFDFLDDFDKPLPSSAWHLDDELSVYIEELWAAGDCLSQAQSTLAAVNHFVPQLRGHSPGVWKKLKTWRRHELPRRATDSSSRAGGALGVLIRFHWMLCGSDVLGLKFCDCMHFCGTVELHLGFTKTGSQKGPENKSRSQTNHSLVFFSVSSERLVCMIPCNFRKCCSRLLSSFGLGKEGYTWHSRRRGGATHFSV